MNLYEISADYQRFQEQVESGEIPEEAIADTLEAIEGNFDDKVDSIACIIKSLLAEAKEIKSERDSLDGRMKQKQKTADRLTKSLKDEMLFSGRTKVETPRNVVKIRNNPPSVEIEMRKILFPSLRQMSLTICSATASLSQIKQLLRMF